MDQCFILWLPFSESLTWSGINLSSCFIAVPVLKNNPGELCPRGYFVWQTRLGLFPSFGNLLCLLAMKFKLLLAVLMGTVVGGWRYRGGLLTPAPGREIRGRFKFTEGPASDAAGNVFFTDQPNDRHHDSGAWTAS